MRTYFETSFTTIEKYRQLAKQWARQIASERRTRKREPNVIEVFDGPVVSALVSDGDYG